MKTKSIKKICVIAPGYPTDNYPAFPFVDQLLCAFTEMQIECTVISPQSILRGVKDKKCKRPTYWERSIGNSSIKVFQPFMFSVSNFQIGTQPISDIAFEYETIKTFKKVIRNEKFDVIYGHFWRCGLLAAKLGDLYGIPAFIACGESVIPLNELRKNIEYKKSLNGIICVSTKSLNECVELELCRKEEAIVCPNAIDNTLFYPRDKMECRDVLGIDRSLFIVAFVGSFINRKGSIRLSNALSRSSNFYSIFIGSGPEQPTCERQLFTGSLPHDQIPVYLSSADVFVLPTLNEGCCNAIVEAMACGLPIVSSDMEFNKDILDLTNSILIDPNDEEAIFYAINDLYENSELRNTLTNGSIEKSKSLTIKKRAETIVKFMEERM